MKYEYIGHCLGLTGPFHLVGDVIPAFDRFMAFKPEDLPRILTRLQEALERVLYATNSVLHLADELKKVEKLLRKLVEKPAPTIEPREPDAQEEADEADEQAVRNAYYQGRCDELARVARQCERSCYCRGDESCAYCDLWRGHDASPPAMSEERERSNREAAARALEGAASAIAADAPSMVWHVPDWLRNRAAALRAGAGEGE